MWAAGELGYHLVPAPKHEYSRPNYGSLLTCQHQSPCVTTVLQLTGIVGLLRAQHYYVMGRHYNLSTRRLCKGVLVLTAG
jgi:hypothetical protein